MVGQSYNVIFLYSIRIGLKYGDVSKYWKLNYNSISVLISWVDISFLVERHGLTLMLCIESMLHVKYFIKTFPIPNLPYPINLPIYLLTISNILILTVKYMSLENETTKYPTRIIFLHTLSILRFWQTFLLTCPTLPNQSMVWFICGCLGIR